MVAGYLGRGLGVLVVGVHEWLDPTHLVCDLDVIERKPPGVPLLQCCPECALEDEIECMGRASRRGPDREGS